MLALENESEYEQDLATAARGNHLPAILPAQEHEGVARTEQLLLIWDGTDTGTRESCTVLTAPC